MMYGRYFMAVFTDFGMCWAWNVMLSGEKLAEGFLDLCNFYYAN